MWHGFYHLWIYTGEAKLSEAKRRWRSWGRVGKYVRMVRVHGIYLKENVFRESITMYSEYKQIKKKENMWKKWNERREGWQEEEGEWEEVK